MKKTVLFIVFNCILLVNAQQLYFTESPETYTGEIDPIIGFKREMIEGFTTSPSVNAGEEVSFKISVLDAWNPSTNEITAKNCTMEIYRVSGTELTNDIFIEGGYSFSAIFYPLRDKLGTAIFPGDYSRKPWDYRWGCNHWSTAITVQTQPTWKSGFYYAKIKLESDPNKIGYIPFVIKPSTQSADILLPIVWNTYQAYNYWGGGSLYWWLGEFESPDFKSNNDPYIRTVSFRRPFVSFPSAPAPTNQFGKIDRFERKMIAWAEANGYELDFCVDSDLNGNELNILNYRMILFAGHSEYWTENERSKIESNFKNSGGNLAFFCANNCYWKVDYFHQPTQSDNPDSMFCEKDWNAYLWRLQSDELGLAHEGRFIGIQYYIVNKFNKRQIVMNKDHWIFRNTNLENGSEFGYGTGDGDRIASGESDMKNDEFTVINAANYETLARVVTGTLPEPYEGLPAYAEVSYYEDEQTNSRVFASGGMGWGYCLYGSNQEDVGRIETITHNILDHFSMKKYIGNVYTDIDNKLEFRSNVQLDGDVTVLTGRWLRMIGVPNPLNITVDNVLFIDGSLEIIGDVTLSGNGSFNINPSGKLILKENAVLRVDSYFVLENGINQIIFEQGSKLIIGNTTLEAASVLFIDNNGTLEISAGSQILAKDGASIEVAGNLICQGEYNNKVLFNFTSHDYDYQNGVKIKSSSTQIFPIQ